MEQKSTLGMFGIMTSKLAAGEGDPRWVPTLREAFRQNQMVYLGLELDPDSEGPDVLLHAAAHWLWRARNNSPDANWALDPFEPIYIGSELARTGRWLDLGAMCRAAQQTLIPRIMEAGGLKNARYAGIKNPIDREQAQLADRDANEQNRTLVRDAFKPMMRPHGGYMVVDPMTVQVIDILTRALGNGGMESVRAGHFDIWSAPNLSGAIGRTAREGLEHVRGAFLLIAPDGTIHVETRMPVGKSGLSATVFGSREAATAYWQSASDLHTHSIVEVDDAMIAAFEAGTYQNDLDSFGQAPV